MSCCWDTVLELTCFVLLTLKRLVDSNECELKLFNESLILAQDERWRRA